MPRSQCFDFPAWLQAPHVEQGNAAAKEGEQGPDPPGARESPQPHIPLPPPLVGATESSVGAELSALLHAELGREVGYNEPSAIGGPAAVKINLRGNK